MQEKIAGFHKRIFIIIMITFISMSICMNIGMNMSMSMSNIKNIKLITFSLSVSLKQK